MGIRKYNPTTPGLRGMTVSTFEEITTDKPEKSLTVTLKKHCRKKQQRQDHRQTSGWRHKTKIQDHRFQKR